MADDVSPGKNRLSLSMKTALGLAIGVGCGLFFGDAFVGLLRMSVLPFIAIPLIASVGHLNSRQASRLSGRVGLALLILWGVGLLSVVLMAATFPPRKSAAFYSNALLESPEPQNFLQLFIPILDPGSDRVRAGATLERSARRAGVPALIKRHPSPLSRIPLVNL